MIKKEFQNSIEKYTADGTLHVKLWSEIQKSYSQRDRYYHNLTHLNSLLTELKVHKARFDNWDTIVFAIAYHDVVYNTLKHNNEERSAALAKKRLTSTFFSKEHVTHCAQLILATKKHTQGDLEMNLFTDADLSILGSDPQAYIEYSKQIRHEYAIYPDLVYNPGRVKVLKHFLDMPEIYKTKEFSEKFEKGARINLETELKSLKPTL